MKLQDNNVKFLLLKIEELTLKVTQQEQHFTKLNESKSLKIDSLVTKVKALETKVKTHKEAETSQTESELHQQRCESEANGRNTIEELKAHYESEIGRMQEGHNKKLAEAKAVRQKLTLKLRIAKEWSRRQAAELEELQAALPQVVTEYKDRMVNVRLLEKDIIIDTEETGKKNMQSNELVKQKELEMNIEKLKKIITCLKNKEGLSEKVSALESTIQDGENAIRRKNLEMSHLMKDNKQLQQDWAKEKDKNAVLLIKLNEVKDNFHSVKEDLRVAQSELKDTRDRLNKTLRENADMGETISNLKDKVRRCEPDLIQEREKNRNLTTYVMRFKADLQPCMDFTEPQTLVSKVLDVKRHHMDTESKVQMDGNNKIGLRQAIAAKDQLIDSCRRCHQNSSRAEKLCQEQIFQRQVQSNQDQSSLVRMVNNITVEQHHVKTQLTETTVLAELARKTPLQKIKSWLRKNVFSTNKVAPINAEEPPSRLPGDNTVHRRADNTSSSKPRPDPEDGLIHVKPFVGGDLQIVDI